MARFEIFKKYSLFDHEVKKKKKYGNFILFNSDFTYNRYYKQQVNQTPNWGLENKVKK